MQNIEGALMGKGTEADGKYLYILMGGFGPRTSGIENTSSVFTHGQCSIGIVGPSFLAYSKD
jgi:hypothetical protein